MRIFVVEDDPNRIEWFRKKFSTVDLTIATSAQDAICTLSLNQEYDKIFLDHDLGGEIMVESGREDTGAEVARYMVSTKIHKNTEVVVHSLNRAGARDIVMILRDAGYFVHALPFINMAHPITGRSR